MKILYKTFAYLGLMAVAGSFIVGFKFNPDAPGSNYFFNIAIYAAYILVHLVMTMPSFKKTFYGKPHSSLGERQIFIIVSVVTWLVVFFLHKPVPGFYFDFPVWVTLIGASLFLFGVFTFFEFANFEVVDGLMGVPGSEMSHSVGKETPLATEGSYARVRHPMYQGAAIYCLASLLIHPNAGQLLFAVMVAASFIGFIPFEESQLVKARGKEYTDYQKKVPYRLFPGIW